MSGPSQDHSTGGQPARINVEKKKKESSLGKNTRRDPLRVLALALAHHSLCLQEIGTEVHPRPCHPAKGHWSQGGRQRQPQKVASNCHAEGSEACLKLSNGVECLRFGHTSRSATKSNRQGISPTMLSISSLGYWMQASTTFVSKVP